LQYDLLPRHYQFLLVMAFLILSLAEGSRLYLGYMGNLQEKPLPLEMAMHSLFLAFLLTEIVAAFLALKTMTRQLAAQFYLQRFKEGAGMAGAGGQAAAEGRCCSTPPSHVVSPSRDH
ncbi:PREDICTED: transmembrane protein 17-like, partial [Eurypyga helias]